MVGNLDQTQHDWPFRFSPRPMGPLGEDANYKFTAAVCGLHGYQKDVALRIMQQRFA